MRGSDLWTDEELQASVEIYLFLLRLEHSGYVISESTLVDHLRGGPLMRRKRSSIRYRMRNISSVLSDHELPRLRAYSPAPQVGSGVRTRLEALLFSRRETGLSALASESGDSAVRLDPNEVYLRAEAALQTALAALQNLQPDTAPIGHNDPPEPIDDFTVVDVREALFAVREARADYLAGVTSPPISSARINTLSRFGVRAASKAAELLWNATDAGFKTAARIAAIALLMTLPPVAQAVETLLKLL